MYYFPNLQIHIYPPLTPSLSIPSSTHIPVPLSVSVQTQTQTQASQTSSPQQVNSSTQSPPPQTQIPVPTTRTLPVPVPSNNQHAQLTNAIVQMLQGFSSGAMPSQVSIPITTGNMTAIPIPLNPPIQETNTENVQIFFDYTSLGQEMDPEVSGISMEQLMQNTELSIWKDEKNSEEEEQEICSICRNPFQPMEILRELNSCSHVFHQACADSWLVQHDSCPMCRCPVLSQN